MELDRAKIKRILDYQPAWPMGLFLDYGPDRSAPMPGDLIVQIDCPGCGRGLDVMHGSDEGEISAVTR